MASPKTTFSGLCSKAARPRCWPASWATAERPSSRPTSRGSRTRSTCWTMTTPIGATPWPARRRLLGRCRGRLQSTSGRSALDRRYGRLQLPPRAGCLGGGRVSRGWTAVLGRISARSGGRSGHCGAISSQRNMKERDFGIGNETDPTRPFPIPNPQSPIPFSPHAYRRRTDCHDQTTNAGLDRRDHGPPETDVRHRRPEDFLGPIPRAIAGCRAMVRPAGGGLRAGRSANARIYLNRGLPMTLAFDPSNDLVQVADGLEAVTLRAARQHSRRPGHDDHPRPAPKHDHARGRRFRRALYGP